MPKRLAASQRVIVNETYPDRRDALSQDWPAYFSRLLPEAVVMPIPNQPERVATWFDIAAPDAVILTNGNDWGEAQERDHTERNLLAIARERRLPVLGLCRGLQALNVLLGGTLEPDLRVRTGIDHVASRHSVRLVVPVFSQLAGSELITVNSYHHQGVTIDGLAHGCRPFALSGEIAVEGFHHSEEPILAVQWHPERPGSTQDFDTALISTFLRKDMFWR